MTSSNGTIFRVTGPLCGELTGPGEFPTQRPVTRSFAVFFDLRLNKRLSKQPWGWWFETPSWSLWCQCNVNRGPDVFNIAKVTTMCYIEIVPLTLKMAAYGLKGCSLYHKCIWVYTMEIQQNEIHVTFQDGRHSAIRQPWVIMKSLFVLKLQQPWKKNICLWR